MMSQVGGISRAGRAELSKALARGRRLLTISDVSSALSINRTEAAKRLSRWSKQGWVRRIQRGLYLAVPLEAENPTQWSEDPLVVADAVWSPCYFTGWTAANHWALTEQLFSTTILKTTKRVRRSAQSVLEMEYLLSHVSRDAMTWGLNTIWRQEHRISMADPARTVIDSLDSPSLMGGVRHLAEVLQSYLMEFDPSQLIDYGDRLGNRAVFKRLGYLLKISNNPPADLIDACKARLSKGYSLLDPSAPAVGKRESDWALLVNVSAGMIDSS
jgi:predicted transcriptional regulator of viral defense system